MKLSELIQRLEDIKYDIGENDPEVQIQHQPRYPLVSTIASVITDAEIAQARAFQDGKRDDMNLDELGHIHIVFLTEGTQLGYGDRLAWQE